MARSMSFTRKLKSEAETARLAQSIAARITSGHTLLLDGPVGAGKTHFARAFIKALLEHEEDVPSPTFTLVQTYETKAGPVWHADLYRLSSDHEVEELGLFDAMDDAICLIEWPDRLGSLAPEHAAWFALSPQDDERHLTVTWSDVKWTNVFEGLTDD